MAKNRYLYVPFTRKESPKLAQEAEAWKATAAREQGKAFEVFIHGEGERPLAAIKNVDGVTNKLYILCHCSAEYQAVCGRESYRSYNTPQTRDEKNYNLAIDKKLGKLHGELSPLAQFRAFDPPSGRNGEFFLNVVLTPEALFRRIKGDGLDEKIRADMKLYACEAAAKEQGFAHVFFKTHVKPYYKHVNGFGYKEPVSEPSRMVERDFEIEFRGGRDYAKQVAKLPEDERVIVEASPLHAQIMWKANNADLNMRATGIKEGHMGVHRWNKPEEAQGRLGKDYQTLKRARAVRSQIIVADA